MKTIRAWLPAAWLTGAALSLVLASTWVPAGAQTAASQSGEITLTGQDLLSAVRLSLTNGIIDYVNGAKHARLSIEWQILPVDGALKEDAAGQLAVPEMIKISNAILAEDHWPRSLPRGLVDAISQDLGGAPLDPNHITPGDLDRWHEKFLADWRSGDKAQGAMRALIPRTYYALLRDHNWLYFVLRGNGIGFYIDAESDQPVRGLPKVEGDHITWVIRQYSFLVDQNKHVWVYRYGISALLDPFDIYISNFAQDKITLSAQVGIRPSQLSVGLVSRLISLENFEVSLPPARQEQVQKIEEGGAVKRVNAVLDLFGAPALGEIVSHGLLSGSERTSLVSGVLASRNRVGGFIGANTDLSVLGRDWRPGLLFGLDPSQADTLYLGPSLRRQALLLSLGARVLSQERDASASAGSSLRGEFGGVLSVDLGQLLGLRREVTQVRVAQAQVGGNWGVSSDFIAGGLGYVQISYTDLSSPSFDAVQVTDASSKPVDAKSAQVIRFRPQPGVRRLFLPAGAYQLEIPPGRQLLDHGFPVTASKRQVASQVIEGYFLDIPSEAAARVDYELH